MRIRMKLRLASIDSNSHVERAKKQSNNNHNRKEEVIEKDTKTHTLDTRWEYEQIERLRCIESSVDYIFTKQ